MSDVSFAGPVKLNSTTLLSTEAPQRFGRERMFFWLAILCLANGLIGDVIRYTADNGVAKALFDVFGINIIVWLAAFSAAALLWQDVDRATIIRPLDRAAAAITILLALVPTSVASLIGLTGLAAYVWQTSERGGPSRRAAVILAAVAVAILWGRILLALFSHTLLRLDSLLVGLLGVQSDGNQLLFARDAGALGRTFIVAPGCSSLHSISAALVFCAVMHGWFNIRPSAKSFAIAGLAIVLVVAINTFRLGAFAYFPQYFEEIHVGWIASLIAWITMGSIVLTVFFGMKREILSNH